MNEETTTARPDNDEAGKTDLKEAYEKTKGDNAKIEFILRYFSAFGFAVSDSQSIEDSLAAATESGKSIESETIMIVGVEHDDGGDKVSFLCAPLASKLYGYSNSTEPWPEHFMDYYCVSGDVEALRMSDSTLLYLNGFGVFDAALETSPVFLRVGEDSPDAFAKYVQADLERSASKWKPAGYPGSMYTAYFCGDEVIALVQGYDVINSGEAVPIYFGPSWNRWNGDALNSLNASNKAIEDEMNGLTLTPQEGFGELSEYLNDSFGLSVVKTNENKAFFRPFEHAVKYGAGAPVETRLVLITAVEDETELSKDERQGDVPVKISVLFVDAKQKSDGSIEYTVDSKMHVFKARQNVSVWLNGYGASEKPYLVDLDDSAASRLKPYIEYDLNRDIPDKKSIGTPWCVYRAYFCGDLMVALFQQGDMTK
ncbi:MAG: hypothetical protein ACI4NF_02895 [Christensenellales bacterium]